MSLYPKCASVSKRYMRRMMHAYAYEEEDACICASVSNRYMRRRMHAYAYEEEDACI